MSSGLVELGQNLSHNRSNDSQTTFCSNEISHMSKVKVTMPYEQERWNCRIARLDNGGLTMTDRFYPVQVEQCWPVSNRSRLTSNASSLHQNGLTTIGNY